MSSRSRWSRGQWPKPKRPPSRRAWWRVRVADQQGQVFLHRGRFASPEAAWARGREFELRDGEWLEIGDGDIWHQSLSSCPGPREEVPVPLERTPGVLGWDDPLRPVYFASRRGLVKIGVSHDPRARCRALDARLLASEPGGPARERQLHDQFSYLRAHGEWFRPGRALTDHINGLRTASSLPPVTF